MILLIFKFLYFCLRITQGCSLINEFQISTLPLEQPFQVVEFNYENWSIKNQEKVEQGIWLKWQPYSRIYKILTSSVECQNEFIYSLERKQEKHILFLLFRELNEGISQDKFKIGLKSHFFKTSEYFYFDSQYFEGVWMFFYASYDIKLKAFSFLFYESELQVQQQIQITISEAIIIDTLVHRVGGIQEKMIFEGLQNCFSQFQGKLTTVLLVQNEEESMENFIKDCYFKLKDCSEHTITFIDDAILNASNFLSFVTPVIQKNYFTLKGWCKMNYEQVIIEKQSLFRITSEVDENYNNFENSILLQIQLIQEEQQATIYFQSFKYDLQNHLAIVLKTSQTEKSYYEAFKYWHFIQIDVTSNKAMLYLFSQYLPQYINKTLDFQSYTGIMSIITIGGDELNSQQHYFGNVYNLTFQTFCNQSQKIEDFTKDCHYSCLKCNGPFEDNCLSCQESNNRVLKNNKCDCNLSSFEIGQSQCLDANNLFSNVYEVEMNCNKIGFDVCDNEQLEIQCSFGYFQYQNDCIKCPYYIQQNNQNDDKIIQCLNCLIFPEHFSIELECNEDAEAFYFDIKNTFNRKKRNQNFIEYFEIVQLTRGQFSLQQKTIRIQNASSFCKIGQYISNDGICRSCGLACEKCENEINCEQCVLGFYLNQNYNCVKCGNNCQACELKNEYLQCLLCLEKHYLTESKQCKSCGQFCAKCDSQGYCNYCENQQKYFISLDGINCLPCNVENCKFCYQIKKLASNAISTFEIHLINLKPELSEDDIFQTQCAKCENGYVLDYQSNFCLNLTTINDECLFGKISLQEFVCLSNQFMLSRNDCNKFNYCEFCTSDQCIYCQDGFYLNVQFGNCFPCRQNCKDCKQQSLKFNDYWKQEIIPFYLFLQSENLVSHQYQQVINSELASDLKIICFECEPDFILQNTFQNITDNGQCIKGCKDDCEQCEIIEFQATCIRCKSSEYGQIRSLNSQQQCLHCPKYCSACYEMETEKVVLKNQQFIASDFNIDYLNRCYQQQNVENGFVYLNTQFNSAIKCQNYEKCYQKVTFEWNIGCDSNYEQNAQIKNYHNIDEFFTQSIINQLEIQQVYAYLNELSVTEINYNLNLIQGDAAICKFPQNVEFKQKFSQNIFSLQNVKLRIFGKGKLTKLSGTLFNIFDFTDVEFINLQFTSSTTLQLNNTFINQILFKDCNLKPQVDFAQLNFQIVSSNSYQLFINNFTMENCFQLNTTMFSFQIQNQNDTILFIQIIDLKILSTKFQNSHFLIIDANSNKNEHVIKFINISFLKSTFTSSTFLNSKGDQFVNFQIQNLTIVHFTIISTSLFQIKNAKTLHFDTGLIQFGELQESSTIIFANQFACLNYQFINVQIIKSTIITNNNNDAPTIINLQQILTITLVNILINQIAYNTGMAILKQVQYEKINYFVNITKLKITQTQVKLDNLQNFENQSVIYMECFNCVLDQIEIVREFGLSEFQIYDSEEIKISNSIFTQNKAKASKWLQKFSCYTTQQNFLSPYLLIDKFQSILFENLSIIQAHIINYPLILILSNEIEPRINSKQVSFKNSFFSDNFMVITSINQQSSIVQTISIHFISIIFQNTTFQFNYLHSFIQNQNLEISATIFVDSLLSNVQIIDSQFIQNFITNTSSSIMFLQVDQLIISSSQFTKSNIIDYDKILNNLALDSTKPQISVQQLSKLFFILSEGGCGKIFAKKIILIDNFINESQANYGGAFYITTFYNSSIQIMNTNFLQTKSLLKGGCFCIQANRSNLTFYMQNSSIEESFSFQASGSFDIFPSLNENLIEFQNVTIINTFAILNLFMSFVNQKLIAEHSNLKFRNIIFIQNKQGFKNYLSLVSSISYSIYSYGIYSTPLIQVIADNIEFRQCIFESEVGLYIAYFWWVKNIFFSDIRIKKSYSNSKLIFANQHDGLGFFTIKNFTVDSLERIELSVDPNIYKNIKQEEQIFMSCLNQNITDTTNINLVDYSEDILNNQYIKNAKTLSQLIIIDSFIGLIHLEQFYFHGEQIYLNKINWLDGLIFINTTRLFDFGKNILILKEVYIKQCSCGKQGILQIQSQDFNYNFFNEFRTDGRILQQNQYDKLSHQLSVQIVISNCFFFKNIATYGAALILSGVDTLIQYSAFIENSAVIGGAIISVDNSKLYFFQTIIAENYAEIAGGIFSYNYTLQASKKLDFVLMNNIAKNFSSDIYEEPQQLVLYSSDQERFFKKIIFFQTFNILIEQTIIEPYKILGRAEKIKTLIFPSGQKISSYEFIQKESFESISYNLTFRIAALNRYYQKLEQLQNSNCTLSYKIINLTSQEELPNFQAKISKNKFEFNKTSGDYNLDDLIIEFNPYYEQAIVLRIFIYSDSIKIPVFDKIPPYLITDYITNYSLFVDVKTFPCQLGEYFNSTNDACYLCDATQFQYQIKFNSTICQFKDEQKIDKITSSMIQLNQQYWRAYYYSSKIEYCFHFIANCQGGWIPGDISCFIGHIGALCEQCDLYNVRGDGSFSVSSPYECRSCSQLKANIISLILTSLWTLISIILTVNSQMLTNEKFKANKKTSILKIRFILKDPQTAVLIKIFTNYIQIISTIQTFQLQVPQNLTGIFLSLGSPIEQMAYNLDCFLIQLTNIPIIYYRVIWNFIIAFLQILIFLMLLFLGVVNKIIKFNIGMISTGLIYVFLFLHPNIIKSIISLLSYRLISEESWIQANVSYLFNTSIHLKWLCWFCIPILIVFAFIIPCIMFINIKMHQNSLDKIRLQEIWGYLYNEYKFNAYYWEFVKIFQKEFIIFVLSFYEDFVAIKASLVFLTIFAYSIFATTQAPYLTGYLNNLDIQSTTVCAVSIILGSSIYLAQVQQFNGIVLIFYAVIIILNFHFFVKILFNIISAYFEKINQSIENLKQFLNQSSFQQYINKIICLQKILQSKKIKEDRIQRRSQKIKSYLILQAKLIIKAKKSNYAYECNEQFIIKNSLSPQESSIKSIIYDQYVPINSNSNIKLISYNDFR